MPFTLELDAEPPRCQLKPAENKLLTTQMPQEYVRNSLGKTSEKLTMEENVPACPNLPESQHQYCAIPVEILLLIAESRPQHPSAGGLDEPLHLSCLIWCSAGQRPRSDPAKDPCNLASQYYASPAALQVHSSAPVAGVCFL